MQTFLKTFIFMLLLSVCSFAQGTSRIVYVNYLSRELATDDQEDFNTLPGVEAGVIYGQSKALGHMVGFAGDLGARVTSSNGGDGVEDRNVSMRGYGARAGARYYFNTGTPLAQPYVGAGVLVQHNTLDNNGTDARVSDTDVGAIALVGIESQVYKEVRANLGVNFTSGQDASYLDLDKTNAFVGLGWAF